MTLDELPRWLADLYADIGRELSGPDSPADAFAAAAVTAARRVPGAEWASITQGRNGSFRTVAATDDRAAALDNLQYDLGCGPCVDAVLQDAVFSTGALATDPRWPEFSRRAATEFGVASMLAYRLFVEGDDVIAGLNLYSTRECAFDAGAEISGILIATHTALAVTAGAARERTAQLEKALRNSRDIGVAMGVLMARHQVTREQAFDLLRVASQHSNRKLSDIALDVADAGDLDLTGVVGPRAQDTLTQLRGQSRPQVSD